MEEFYLYCLNHEKPSFNKAIQPDKATDEKLIKTFVESEVQFLLNKDTIFSLSNKTSTKDTGQYIAHSVNKISIVKKSDTNFIGNNQVPTITVDIELKSKDLKKEEDTDTATDCKSVKKGLSNTIKSWTQKASNAVELWKMDFDTNMKNYKRGGKKTRKYRKKKIQKKTRRSLRF